MPNAAVDLTTNVETAFADAIRAAGISPPSRVIADGQIHRFPTSTRPADQAGWYMLHADHPAAGAFGCWRSGIKQVWSAFNEGQMSPDDLEHHRRRMADLKAKTEEERKRKHAEAAEEALHRWDSASSAPDDHPYLRRKQIKPHGVRVDTAGRLMVPLYDGDRMTSLQAIAEDGAKRFLPGGRKHGAYYQIAGDGPLVIAEGFATAASIAEATGYSVAVAFDAGNLEPVARKLRAQNPMTRVIIAADNDESGVGQEKAQAAIDAVGGAVVTPPDIGTDWNDVAVLQGLEAVTQAFRAAASRTNTGKPDLSVLNENRRAAPALPLDVFGPWREWLEVTAESKSAPVDYVAVSLLTGAASIIGNARWISPWQGWEEPCALWAALIGQPSSGKSPALAPVISMMRTLESELASSHEDDLRQWRTEVEAAKCAKELWQGKVKTAVGNGNAPPPMPANAVDPDKPARPRLAVSDTTPEALAAISAGQPRGLLAYRDELSSWLGGFDRYGKGSGERGFWLEAYGGRPYIVDRKNLDTLIRIPRLTVSVLGGIQPDKLVSTLMTGDDDGLASRLLLTWPEPVPPSRPRRVADDGAALDAIRRLRSLQMPTDEHGVPAPVVVVLADDAADLFDNWRRDHTVATDAATGMLAGHFGKMPGMLLRLALVLQHLWWCRSADDPPQAISLRATTAAAALIDTHFKPMAERAYGDAAMPEADRLAATLARWIVKERVEVVNTREVRRSARLPGLKEAAKVKLAIETLVEANFLDPAFERDGPNKGRPRENYTVNPVIWELLS